MNQPLDEKTPVQLRSKAPYTCRFEIAGKPCAAILSESDSNFCTNHAAAQDKFFSAPVASINHEIAAWTRGPIWP